MPEISVVICTYNLREASGTRSVLTRILKRIATGVFLSKKAGELLERVLWLSSY